MKWVQYVAAQAIRCITMDTGTNTPTGANSFPLLKGLTRLADLYRAKGV